MKRMQSIVVLASLFALAAPAWSGDTKLSASHVSASPQTRSQVQKATPKLQEATVEEQSPEALRAKPSLLLERKLVVKDLLGPDLTVEAVPPQGNTSMRFFMRNLGAKDAEAFEVSFLCSYIPYSNGLADPGLRQDCDVPTISVSGVAAGAVDSRQIPAELLPQGPVLVSVTVKVDSKKQVAETNEFNNSDSTSWH
jgi:hypothetical protein